MIGTRTGGAALVTGDSIYVHEAGTAGAPAVVFLHGAGASGRMWREHMDRLGDRYHCLALDLPGFGRSNRVPFVGREATADLVAGLIEARVPERRAHVVGLSWGGAIAHTLLGGRPDLVDRAVIDGAGLLTSTNGAFVVLGVRAVSPFLHTRPVVALFGDMIGMDEEGRDDLRAASPRAFRGAFVEGFSPVVSRAEMRATSPTLLVAGEKETEVRGSHAAQASLMPHAVAAYAPGGAHGWLARRPELHARMVEAWLTGAPLPTELAAETAWPDAAERMRRELGKEAPDGDHRTVA